MTQDATPETHPAPETAPEVIEPIETAAAPAEPPSVEAFFAPPDEPETTPVPVVSAPVAAAPASALTPQPAPEQIARIEEARPPRRHAPVRDRGVDTSGHLPAFLFRPARVKA